jgi:hypothetical protein
MQTKFDWRSLMDSRDPKFLVKGSELSQTIVPHTQSRFAIVETRCIESDGQLGVMYRVRDADTVTDAQIKEGKRPAIVHHTNTFEGAMEWVQGEMFKMTL